jgi:release factor glutamine methyltransferase
VSGPLSLAEVTDRLTAAGCIAADEEADELVGSAPDPTTLASFVRRREQGEPLAWITGAVRFCGRRVRVDVGVYVPRPQTEELARRAEAYLAAVLAPRAADLCTGSGAVALHLMSAVPGSSVVGVDVDQRAVRCARRNGVAAIVGDLADPLVRDGFDVVTSVVPYVPTSALRLLPSDVVKYEPRIALDGGSDGLQVARQLVAGAAELLRPGGRLLVELGAEQDELLERTLLAAGFGELATWSDEEGALRGLEAQLTI